MLRYARIAAIVLGAFALGIVVVIGWRALVSEATDLSDRVRRARCDWVDPLVVSVGGQVLSLEATPGTTIHTGATWIGGEEVTGYRSQPLHFGFCLDSKPNAPLPVQAVTIALDAARARAEEAGLPEVAGPVLEIGEAALFLPGAPPAVDGGTQLTVFYRNVDHGWPHMATDGVDRNGFRIGAVCRDGAGAVRLCDVSVHDTRSNLSYRFGPLPVEVVEFDRQPVPPAFQAAAQGMRVLVGMLKDDAVAQR